jgi:XTP/dITP diphosphohydrolase
MRRSQKVVLATLNPDKFREFKAIFALQAPELELIPAEAVLRNPEKLSFVENHSTYLDNAAAKARLVNHGSHYPAIADDTGLECAALGGAPGVRTFRYAELPAQNRSRAAQDEANIQKLLTELKKTKGSREARFVTTLTLLIEGILIHATGVLEGLIAESPRGTDGFGYDSIFVPKGSDKTLAEMNEAEKNALSHRAAAVTELLAQVRARGMVLAKP